MKETLENLAKAFIGESQARNRYTFYAKAAKAEGYEQISAIFLETAEQERSHASSLWKMIQNIRKNECLDFTALHFEAEFPAIHGSTADNLKAAIAGENYETERMYPEFANVAEKEGYADVAVRLRAIGRAEKHHETRYQKLLALVGSGNVFKEAKKVKWVCRECGYEHEGTEPPEKCPSCEHARSYFQRRCVD
ncbi:MAG: rubrerythrin family protein, partial [Methanomassiliicoccales archaeon]|nr:rubrerythrin family protein [Methanomassiliicoccales archaeon]